MKFTRSFFVSLLPLLPICGATIDGVVSLPKSQTAPVKAQHYEIVTTGGVVATNPPLAVVYLEGNFLPPATPPTAVLSQKDLVFIPSLLPVRVGTRVEFPNLDDLYHNIFSFSAAKRFDLGRYRPDDRPVPSQVFDKPGLITLRCEIHEHMRGLILVLDTPYFGVTDAAGRFKLTDLPPGKFVLKAWVDSNTTRSQPVELTDVANLRLDFP
jgi:plastocyanin